MAYEIPGLLVTFEAAEDLSSHQYKFVTLTSSGTVDLMDAATDIPIGILQNDPAAGEEAQVMLNGISKVIAAEALVTGNSVCGDADGKAEVIAAGTDTTRYAVGQVVAAAGAADRIGSVAFDCTKPARAA